MVNTPEHVGVARGDDASYNAQKINGFEIPPRLSELLAQVLNHGWGDVHIVVREHRIIKVIPSFVVKVD